MFITIVFVFIALVVRSQDIDSKVVISQEQVEASVVEALGENLKRYNENNTIEKVYIHTDKDLFLPGEDLWYSGYTVLGSNYKYSNSKVLYVDLINFRGDVILSQTREILEGRSSGSIELPKNILPGDYQLRAYTSWMRNFDANFFFTKRIKVLASDYREGVSDLATKNRAIDVQFFPEGGDLVEGINSLVAFKAIGGDGLSREINGKVLNSKGKAVAFIRSIHKGAGFFNLKPESRETYTAELSNGSKYVLQTPRKEGYVITVDNADASNLFVRVEASESLKNKPFYLFLGQLQTQNYYQGKFKFRRDPYINIVIPKKNLPSGVITMTLLDEDKKPLNERSLFINKEEELVIQTQLNKSVFQSRDEIVLDISVTDKQGMPVSTDLLLAITDLDKVEKSINTKNILTHLLLESDIKGHIEDPGFYFKDKSITTRTKLDLIMLTHGWRRFNWKDINDKDQDTLKIFNVERGKTIAGTAMWTDRQPFKNRNLDLVVKEKDGFAQYSLKTDEEGRFKIDNFNHTDSIKLVFNTKRKNDELIRILIDLDEIEIPKFPEANFRLYQNDIYREPYRDYIENAILQIETDSLFDLRFNSKETTRLDKVDLEAEIERKGNGEHPNSAPSTFGIDPDKVVYTKGKEFQSLGVLLSGVGGLSVVPGNPPSVSIRRFGGSPLWVLDGAPINATGNGIPLEIANLNGFVIERIEIAKSASNLALFGLRGGNGVILVYTKRGDGRVRKVVSPEFTLAGYSGAKEFYSPKYDVKKEEHIKPDYRTTLYWNPSITTDKNGKASVTFFNSDITENIQIDIQGLSENGILGTYLKAFGKTDENK
ncbi:hypothetical protein D7030_06390 [Flavobacteriaceae bacterium AU392]|nr:hypothetical protein D1817_02030 [Flavobacteriaceae bacterium]RKM84763.1 hypothetical protein D7030_06390 [Flavobacteriaceae bacterium AU392]